ncbi:Tim44/TimA family putative adaptor protein [Oryzibacter oryziterrae]|uniref:Tim44/TimA family putative adaptor protein n=1 Tax=Oryzibacter oryziterrae TaxID=2766474 RepID=UPI001F2B79EF|nr:Tim44/TimA family putative adaptor protein [Oryzibacter oryziterrae]
MDFTSLIFLVVAIVIFWRLRSVLGTRTGREKPPVDPFVTKAPQPAPEPGDNVITLPSRTGRSDPAGVQTDERLEQVAPAGTALNAALRSVMAADRSFDVDSFLTGARAAYEMIVTAFASGDREALRNLLSREVFDGFSGAIGERERRRETMDFTFVGVDKADITEASVTGGTVQVAVRFSSQLISVTKAADGSVVDGDPLKVSTVNDLWTFAREVRSADPNWKLVATEGES